MGRAIATSAIVAVLALSPPLAAEAANWQHLYWPQLALSKDRGERVTAISVEMACARFRAVSNIPDDWSLEISSPSSDVTHLRASAGHGTSMLWSLRDIDGSIGIAVREPSCFDISATVTVDIAGHTTKEYKFNRSELRIRP